MSLDLTVYDQFCGAGGSSQGVRRAGATVRLAMNHNPVAIASHSANFPDVEHACEDIRDLDPGRFARVDVLISSPECKARTYARGKGRREQDEPLFETEEERVAREMAQRSRATMDQVIRWMRVHDYQAAIIENVGELVDWWDFDVWLREIDNLGYRVQFCWFNSMFFGGGTDGPHPPQSRDRLYLVLTKKGNPKPDLEFRPRAWCPRCQADVDAVQRLKDLGRRRKMCYRRQYDYGCPACGAEAFPYVAPAATAIDWTIPTTGIGERPKPLKPATLQRIREGLVRYGWAPQMVPVERPYRDGELEVKLPRPVGLPARTQTGRNETGLLRPPLVITNREHATPKTVQDPTTAMLTGLHHLLVTERRNTAPRGLGEPAATVAAGGTHHLLVEHPDGLVVSNHTPGWVRPADELPAEAVTGTDHHALLLPTNGNLRRGRDPRAEVAPTQTGDKGYAVVELPLIDVCDGVVRPAWWPMPAQTGVQGDGLVVPAGGGWADRATEATVPFPTQTGRGSRGLLRLPDGLVVQVGGNTWARPGSACRVRPSAWPMRAQTGALQEALVTVPPDFLRPYRPPAPPLRGRVDEAALEALVNACGYRMVTWWEIRAVMGFDPGYVLRGNQREKVYQLGQAVTPPVMAWLFRRVADSLARRR